MIEKVFETIPAQELYGRTGIQFARLNTLFQLAALRQDEPETLAQAETLLLMPDLFAYLLTGVKRAGIHRGVHHPVPRPENRRLGLRFAGAAGHSHPPVPAHHRRGPDLRPAVRRHLRGAGRARRCRSIAVATHDTGSAVAAVPTQQDDFIYISCGTWSLFGTELPAPVINETSRKYNLTNEGGYGRTVRFLKNIMGLWLIQESRRQWIREGADVSYADLEREALAAKPFQCFINPDDPSFEMPGNLPRRVQEFCRKTGQYVPETRGEIMRCIYESLAMRYRYTRRSIEEVTGRSYEAIHMIGGGTKDRLLCQMTADACRCEVVAGPIEATAMGNIAVQLIALGELKDLKEARRVIADSEPLKHYAPESPEVYDEAYGRFEKLL